MKPEEKNKLISALMGRRMKGDEAARQWELLRPLFEAQQARYTADLIEKTVANGEVYDAAVWKLVALDDMFLALEHEMLSGRDAVRKLDKLAEESKSAPEVA